MELERLYPNIIVINLPNHASWLNQAEVYLSIDDPGYHLGSASSETTGECGRESGIDCGILAPRRYCSYGAQPVSEKASIRYGQCGGRERGLAAMARNGCRFVLAFVVPLSLISPQLISAWSAEFSFDGRCYANLGEWEASAVVSPRDWRPGLPLEVRATLRIDESHWAALAKLDGFCMLVTAERTFDADGRLRLPSDERMSTLVTPTGLAIEGGEFYVIERERPAGAQGLLLDLPAEATFPPQEGLVIIGRSTARSVHYAAVVPGAVVAQGGLSVENGKFVLAFDPSAINKAAPIYEITNLRTGAPEIRDVVHLILFSREVTLDGLAYHSFARLVIRGNTVLYVRWIRTGSMVNPGAPHCARSEDRLITIYQCLPVQPRLPPALTRVASGRRCLDPPAGAQQDVGVLPAPRREGSGHWWPPLSSPRIYACLLGSPFLHHPGL